LPSISTQFINLPHERIDEGIDDSSRDWPSMPVWTARSSFSQEPTTAASKETPLPGGVLASNARQRDR